MRFDNRNNHSKDGDVVFYRTECKTECNWYRALDGISVCGGGKDFKYLLACGTHPSSRCRLKDRPNEEPAVNYIDEQISEYKSLIERLVIVLDKVKGDQPI